METTTPTDLVKELARRFGGEVGGHHRAGARHPPVPPGESIYAYRVYTLFMSEQPLREPAFLVLTALAGEPRHGYSIVEDILRISDGRIKLHTGTLYGVLDRLREAGLVEVEREEIVDSRLRRYYRLSAAGAERLAAEADRMQRNASAAASRLRRLRPEAGTI